MVLQNGNVVVVSFWNTMIINESIIAAIYTSLSFNIRASLV